MHTFCVIGIGCLLVGGFICPEIIGIGAMLMLVAALGSLVNGSAYGGRR
jgi:hypothetical protein